jgi:phosphatidylserine decarboxylase
MKTLLLQESPYIVLFIIISWSIAAYLGRVSGPKAIMAIVATLTAMAYIYRKPEPIVRPASNIILKPAAGRIMWTKRRQGPASADYVTGRLRSDRYTAIKYNDNMVRPRASVSPDIVTETVHTAIFLNPLDIHIQIIPIDSYIVNVRPLGSSWSRWPAMLALAADHNQAVETVLRPVLWPEVIIRVIQISGFLLPRAVSFLGPTKAHVAGSEPTSGPRPAAAGTHLGIIKFGSRVDIIVEAPASAISIYGPFKGRGHGIGRALFALGRL